MSTDQPQESATYDPPADPRVADLRKRLDAAEEATASPDERGRAKLAAQHKLAARARIDLLLDEGTFVEDGRYANATEIGRAHV